MCSPRLARVITCNWLSFFSTQLETTSLYIISETIKKVCIQAKWPIRPELILVSEA